ncbi:MAG TPA: hypothetical protein VMZ28_02850 [Kofleriaceae bacterium]|nr:hypothetical protein [Kofleriaceae bacterium]
MAGSLASRISVGARGADWIATATPWLAVLAAAAAAVLVHRWRRISERAPTIAVAALSALPALLAAQLARLVEVAAVAQDHALGADWWSAVDWLSAVSLDDVIAVAPGLRRVAATAGVEGTWVALGCEALLLGALVLVAADLALSAPLCGACRRWGRTRHGVAGSAADAPFELLEEHALRRDWLFFRSLGRPRTRRVVRFDLVTCPTPGCDRASAVSLYLMRPFLRDRPLVVHLRVGPDDVRTILAMRPRRPSGRSRVPRAASL